MRRAEIGNSVQLGQQVADFQLAPALLTGPRMRLEHQAAAGRKRDSLWWQSARGV